MKYIVCLLSLFVLIGCATKRQPLDASVYLLSTDKDPNWLLGEIRDDLKKNKYEVENFSSKVGALVMAPRDFVILRDGARTRGTQSIQVQQEGGSVKVTMSYTCSYPEGQQPCNRADDEAVSKIRRIERLIISMINRRLFKRAGEERVKSKIIE